jgi:hypothetical protein
MNEKENQDFFISIKYVIEVDDDVFIRVDQLLRWISAIDSSGISHFPLVGNSDHTKVRKKGDASGEIWHIKGCKEITSTGWYHPFMINKPAMERLQIASASYGFSETCHAFDVSQDVGGEIYFWFFQFYHIYIPGIELNNHHQGKEIFSPTQMMLHSVKHDHDHCIEEKDWPVSLRYQEELVIGCGNIDHHSPYHNAEKMIGMYDAWEYYRDHGKDIEIGIEGKNEWIRVNVTIYPSSVSSSTATATVAADEDSRIIIKEILPVDTIIDKGGLYKGDKVLLNHLLPTIQLINGYENTKHAKENDIIHKQWKEFTLHDCNPPGYIG